MVADNLVLQVLRILVRSGWLAVAQAMKEVNRDVPQQGDPLLPLWQIFLHRAKGRDGADRKPILEPVDGSAKHAPAPYAHAGQADPCRVDFGVSLAVGFDGVAHLCAVPVAVEAVEAEDPKSALRRKRVGVIFLGKKRANGLPWAVSGHLRFGVAAEFADTVKEYQ